MTTITESQIGSTVNVFIEQDEGQFVPFKATIIDVLSELKIIVEDKNNDLLEAIWTDGPRGSAWVVKF